MSFCTSRASAVDQPSDDHPAECTHSTAIQTPSRPLAYVCAIIFSFCPRFLVTLSLQLPSSVPRLRLIPPRLQRSFARYSISMSSIQLYFCLICMLADRPHRPPSFPSQPQHSYHLTLLPSSMSYYANLLRLPSSETDIVVRTVLGKYPIPRVLRGARVMPLHVPPLVAAPVTHGTEMILMRSPSESGACASGLRRDRQRAPSPTAQTSTAVRSFNSTPSFFPMLPPRNQNASTARE
ncbi:hypothetical protein C8R44DRAFT_879610 [Mycena epipterygia]|nr:hypothetical protein C8R44DRAFT_879610 [Mycena epipterygia]